MQQPSLKHVTDMSAPPSGSASRQATGTEPEAFLAEKVGLLYNNLAYSVLINSVGATIVAGGLWATGGGWLLGLWLAVMYAVNSARAWLRYRYANRPWFGHPVAVLGAAKTGRLIVRTLKATIEGRPIPFMMRFIHAMGAVMAPLTPKRCRSELWP